MKYYIPVLCLVFLGLGAFAGAHYKEREFGALVEQRVVADTAFETRLHTVAVGYLREGEVERTIELLEGSLSVKAAILETCKTPGCAAALAREVKEANQLIIDYHKKYSVKE